MAGIVVLGATGQLGSDLCREFPDSLGELTPLSHADIEVCDHAQVAEKLTSLKPSVVVNTTAFHKVEACEEDPQRAFAVNAIAVRNLARVCQQLGSRLVHISTDYVFGGDHRTTPYEEEAPINPLNVYGVSKAAGEQFVRNICARHVIVRTSGLFGLRGASGKGGNFVETMLRLGRERGAVSVVTDQVLSPTNTRDLAQAIWKLVQAHAQGTFHVTNSGSCSWYEFACAIFQLKDPNVKVSPTTSSAFGSKVARPSYSVLDNRRLREMGLGPLRPWREALKAYLDARG